MAPSRLAADLAWLSAKNEDGEAQSREKCPRAPMSFSPHLREFRCQLMIPAM
jgi:hypothetical protein